MFPDAGTDSGTRENTITALGNELTPIERPPAPEVSIWSDPTNSRIEDDGDCPEHLWTLFPGRAPGENEFAQRRNNQQRHDLLRDLRQTVFVLGSLDSGNLDATLGEYDFRRHAFPVDVPGMATCGRSLLHARYATTIAFGRPRWEDEGTGFLSRHEWRADPMRFWVPVPESEAPAFRDGNRRNLGAMVAFRVRSGQQPRSIGGVSTSGTEAGRLVSTSIVGIQVFRRRDHRVIVDVVTSHRHRH